MADPIHKDFTGNYKKKDVNLDINGGLMELN